MGFQLFETSGTFNPALWGLKAGDMLYILAIGGAGGGGGVRGTSYYQSAGGNSGCLIIKSYQLTSTASIAVTVGNGGKGGYMSNWSNYGGGGARGCVYVFW